MSNALTQYRLQEKQLRYVWWRHCGLESDEEDNIRDVMEKLWWELTDTERDQIDAEPPLRRRNLPTVQYVDKDVAEHSVDTPVRELVAAG